MINNNITEEIKEKVFKWVDYINNGHYGNARDIVNTYNMVFNNIKQPQAYTNCGSCLKRCVVQMKNEIERNDKELEEEKLNALKELDAFMMEDEEPEVNDNIDFEPYIPTEEEVLMDKEESEVNEEKPKKKSKK